MFTILDQKPIKGQRNHEFIHIVTKTPFLFTIAQKTTGTQQNNEIIFYCYVPIHNNSSS